MQTAWLIEFGSPAVYYCAPGDWCSNANHAQKFETKEAADLIAATMTFAKPRVCEHAWCSE